MWYDKAAEQIDQDLDDGNMSNEEYREAMRDLNAEYEGSPQPRLAA